MAVHDRACGPGKYGDPALAAECTKGGCKPVVATCLSGADLSEATAGKAPSERPALQPYPGKPAVRNERGIEETSASCEARSAPHPTRPCSCYATPERHRRACP